MSAIPFLSVGDPDLPSHAGPATSGRWRRRAPPRTSVSVRLADAQGACSLSDYVDAHRTRRAFDLAGGGLDVVCVEVAHLDGRDLADLVLGDPSHRPALRRRGALLDAGCLAQEVGRRGRLEDECERAILEDRDLGRDHLAGLVGRPLVVRLGELDDVDAVRAQGRANGRGGCRLAGRQLEGQDDADLLGHGWDESFLARISAVSAKPSGRGQGGGEHVSERTCVRERARGGDNAGLGRPVGDHSFSTWRKSSSTGVSRPKMLTRTLTLFRSGLTSSTVPMNSANGPSVTRTLWPFVKATRNFGVSTPMCRRICLTSFSSSGIGSLRTPGMFAPPTKLVTPGVFRTTNQLSGSRIISTRT